MHDEAVIACEAMNKCFLIDWVDQVLCLCSVKLWLSS